MDFNVFDIITFVGFLAVVVAVSLYVGRKEDNTEDYFLAGRGLTWWVIGLSLIASNISTEHFIGMAGQGFKENIGMAIASYEWIAAFSLVIVALFFLPKFLRSGIYTIPQYLEFRYGKVPRTMMAVFMLIFYVGVTIAVVLYAGAVALNTIFDMKITHGVWLIGVLAGAYTVYGGLKAVVWSDVIQGITLLVGGIVVTYLSFEAVGGVDQFIELSEGRLHTVLPANHPELPWVAVFVGGMWIPNLFYWGLNQFITQRTLAAKSINEGQKGILFGASLKLIIPFIVVFPGIIAYELYGSEISNADSAYPYLIKQILPTGLIGIMFAALFGATMSTLDSLLNSAATIFTIDIYKPFIRPQSSPKYMVTVGRVTTVVLVVLACLWAPIVDTFEGGLYKFIQIYWGFVQPGVVAAFFFGILWKKVPSGAVVGGMIINFPLYFILIWQFPEIAFLHHMAICLVVIALFTIIYTLISPMKKEVVMPVRENIEYKLTKPIIVWSVLVVVATASLYIIFF